MCLSEVLDLPDPDDHWKDVKGAAIFLLEPTDPGGSIGSCSLRWYVRGLGGTDNTDSGCALKSLRPSYSAT